MTSRKTKTTANAVETAKHDLQVARAALDAATATAQEVAAAQRSGANTSDEALRRNLAQQAVLLAEDVVREKEAALAVALDVEALHGGDRDMAAADLELFKQDTGELLTERLQILALLDDNRQRTAARSARARAAADRLEGQRHHAGMPPPRANIVMRNWISVFAEPAPRGTSETQHARDLLTRLDALAVPEPKTSAVRLGHLRQEERELRLTMERAHQAAEEQRKEREAEEKASARRREQERRDEARRHEEWAAKVQARAAEEEVLLDAQKRRERKGGAA